MRILKKCVPFICVIIIWQALAYCNVLNTNIIPSPLQIGNALVTLSTSGDLFTDVFQSIKRVGVGFLIAALFGVMLGIISGYFKRCAEIVHPLCEFLRPIPPIAWIPIAILWFGLGDAPAYFIVFIGAFFPIFINTYWGVRGNRASYIHVARNFDAPWNIILSDVILPASLPHILKGLRIGLGLAWTSVISAELVGAQNGLGYMIQLNRIMLKTYNIVAGMIVIGLIGLVMNYVMAVIERKITFWNQETFESIHRCDSIHI